MRLVAASELGGKVPDSVAGLFAQVRVINKEVFFVFFCIGSKDHNSLLGLLGSMTNMST
jgi:hypothetical protein